MEQNKVIQICFPLYDKFGTYSKYEGVAIESLLINTSSSVYIHILHDDTLNEVNKKYFRDLVNKYHQKISFHFISMPDELSAIKALKNFTIGTMFRLKILDIFPYSIKKIIYLDADVLVNLDIKELWNMESQGNSILAMKDKGFMPAESQALFDKKILNKEKYFNAGVMVLNLDMIRRKHDLYQEAVRFLLENPECPFADQDALNNIFQKEVKFISDKFNFFTLLLRGTGKPLQDVIYHFAGDHPYSVPQESFDRLFFDTLLNTPWGNSSGIREYYTLSLQSRDKQVETIRSVLLNSRNKKYVFWGAAGMLAEKIISFFCLDEESDYCVDNNSRLWGEHSGVLRVCSPKILQDEKNGDVYVVVISNLHYPEIKEQLEQYGMIELKDFVDGRLVLLERENGKYIL